MASMFDLCNPRWYYLEAIKAHVSATCKTVDIFKLDAMGKPITALVPPLYGM